MGSTERLNEPLLNECRNVALNGSRRFLMTHPCNRTEEEMEDAASGPSVVRAAPASRSFADLIFLGCVAGGLIALHFNVSRLEERIRAVETLSCRTGRGNGDGPRTQPLEPVVIRRHAAVEEEEEEEEEEEAEDGVEQGDDDEAPSDTPTDEAEDHDTALDSKELVQEEEEDGDEMRLEEEEEEAPPQNAPTPYPSPTPTLLPPNRRRPQRGKPQSE